MALWRAENLPSIERRRAQRVLVLGPTMLTVQCFAWSLFFAWQGDRWAMLSTMVLLVFALGSFTQISKHKPGFVEVMMFVAVTLLITGMTVAFDAPTSQSPTTLHLFLLPLAVAAFMAFSEARTWVSVVLSGFCLTCFLGLAVSQWTPIAGVSVSDEVRVIAKWLNSIASLGLLLALLYVLNTDAKEHAGMDKELQIALEEKQFVLYYQPQLNQRNQVIGAEVLIRWQHPERGLLAPGAFIDHAERNGLMVPLGHWVIEQACKKLKRWQSDPLFSSLELAVNVSQAQFRQEDFAQNVLQVVQEYGIEPQRLELELTETLMVLNMEDLQHKMKALVERGIRFSLDDFGTGFSSLSLLRQLPLHTLKIDRSFITDLPHDEGSTTIVKTLLGLARSMGLTVVAEGIETPQQHKFLLDHACPVFQGYLFSKPLPLAEFIAFVREHNTPLETMQVAAPAAEPEEMAL